MQVLGGIFHIKSGQIPRGTSTLDAGGSFVFAGLPGGAVSGFFYVDYFSTNITLIAGDGMTTYLTYSKEANSRTVTYVNSSSADAPYVLIEVGNQS